MTSTKIDSSTSGELWLLDELGIRLRRLTDDELTFQDGMLLPIYLTPSGERKVLGRKGVTGLEQVPEDWVLLSSLNK